ncbi:hypothetical protein A1D23_07555 [Chelonobacter oris]|uniref:MmcQ protein n=1 Tax=Chelonobacter oris TaxID=505317 RepID=A0A0A3B849_9PAST|nr:MmcQ/YjbR family DNA-binding protein [Chelonobacter oris]KGQ69759.1 hypothetical protein OA57_08945 [Chelonobacter oris]MDH2999942.1 hypothetical protein [Chelonobacter oris]
MLSRTALLEYIASNYAVEAEYPWKKFPRYAVFRHLGSRKWFCLIADVDKQKIGLNGDGKIDLLNLKCPPELIDSLRQAKGFLPAYHMNKTHWLSIVLDGSVPYSEIFELLDISFRLTQ